MKKDTYQVYCFYLSSTENPIFPQKWMYVGVGGVD